MADSSVNRNLVAGMRIEDAEEIEREHVGK